MPSGLINTGRKRTKLSSEDEAAFQDWFAGMSELNGTNPDPDDVRHAYDARGLFAAMKRDPERYTPRLDPEDGKYHGSSEFKDDDHPNRFIKTPDGVLDSKYDKFIDRDRL